MSTKNPLNYTTFVLMITCSMMIIQCTDSNLEPVGGNPETGEPEEEAVNNPRISDNPVLRMNCGGEEVGYGDTVYTADFFFNETSKSLSNRSIQDILETDMDSIYITERTSDGDEGNFEYSIPIDNGSYKLKLHFAEIFWGAPGGGAGASGARVFDVEVEGEVVLDDYDIFSKVGAMTATIEEFIITIDDRNLNIKFTAGIDQPKISVIEVLGDGQILAIGG